MKGMIDDAYLGDASVVQMKNDLVNRSRDGVRAIRELDNVVNMQWYHGRPWYVRNAETNRLVGMPPQMRQRYIYLNKTFSTARTIKGVMYYEPQVETSPRTGDAEDKARAYLEETLGMHIVEAGGLARAYSRVIDMCNIKGLGVIKGFWDPTAGGRRPMFSSVPCQECQGSGMLTGQFGISACWRCAAQGLVPGPQGWQGIGQEQQYMGTEPEGEFVFKSVDMDDLWFDPEAETPEDAERIVHRIRMPLSRAWALYGKNQGMHEEDFRIGQGQDENATYLARIGAQYSLPAQQEYVRVYEYYQRPNERFPRGVFGVVIGNQAMAGGPLPYDHDTQPFPFFCFPMYEVYGLLYPLSTVDLALPLIIAMSDHMTTKHVTARLRSRLRFKVPRGSNFQSTDKDGNVYYTRLPGGDKPEEMRHSAITSDTDDIIKYLADEIQDTTGVNDVLAGRYADQSLGNTRAMAYLDENAVRPFKPIIENHARILEKAMRYGIDVAAIHMPDSRIMRRMGTTGAVELVEWRASDPPESNDVSLKSVRGKGRSRSVMMAEADEALAKGAMTVDEYRDVGEFGRMGTLYDEAKSNDDHAMLEQKMLMDTGQMPAPLRYQVAARHMKMHTAFALRLQKADPNHPLLPALFMHMAMTEEIDAQDQVKKQMLQQGDASGYGMANAADGSAQPQGTQQAAASAGTVQASGGGPNSQTDAFQTSPAGAPGTQPSYGQAASTASSYDGAAQVK